MPLHTRQLYYGTVTMSACSYVIILDLAWKTNMAAFVDESIPSRVCARAITPVAAQRIMMMMMWIMRQGV